MKRRALLTLCGRSLNRGGMVGALLQGAWPVRDQEPSGRTILDRVERLLWGRTVQGDYEMTITRPRWQRTLDLQVWMERPGRSFVRIRVLAGRTSVWASADSSGTAEKSGPQGTGV
jgi:hypothetical protein